MKVAFFDYHDVFEDFFPQYGVTQEKFATSWVGTGSQALLALMASRGIEVVWHCMSLAPKVTTAAHAAGYSVRFRSSSAAHRALWHVFYGPRASWRWRRLYPLYAPLASSLSVLSAGLVRELAADPPDVILCQDYATTKFDVLVALAHLLGVRVVAFHAGSAPEMHVGKRTKHWSIARVDMLLASSRAEESLLVERYGVRTERVRTVLTPIDTEVFRPGGMGAAKAAVGLQATRRFVLYVGRLDDRVKRVSTLVEAFASVADTASDMDLVLVGDGPDREKLEALAGTILPGRVRFMGWIADAKAKAMFYRAAEYLVLPSRSEGFPTVVGEAMACGLPVVATDVGGVSELVSGSTGWLVQPDNDSALRAAMMEASVPGECDRRRAAARATALERVSPSVVGDQLEECLHLAVAGRGRLRVRRRSILRSAA